MKLIETKSLKPYTDKIKNSLMKYLTLGKYTGTSLAALKNEVSETNILGEKWYWIAFIYYDGDYLVDSGNINPHMISWKIVCNDFIAKLQDNPAIMDKYLNEVIVPKVFKLKKEKRYTDLLEIFLYYYDLEVVNYRGDSGSQHNKGTGKEFYNVKHTNNDINLKKVH